MKLTVNTKNHLHFNLRRNSSKTPFAELPLAKQAQTLIAAATSRRERLLKELETPQIVRIISTLDGIQSQKILKALSFYRRNKIIDIITGKRQNAADFLTKLDPRLTQNYISLDYIQVDQDSTFASVIQSVRSHEAKTGKFPAVLVLNAKGALIGELPAHLLALAHRHEKIRKHLKPIPYLRHNKTGGEIAKIFIKYAHKKIALVDETKSIVGILYADDILRLIRRQSSKSLNEFAGVNEEEDILDPSLAKVQHRYKWLILNLATAFLAAFVVGLFDETIAKYVILAAYLPIVAGMGGNAATQTLAVIVRGIALKEIEFGNAKKAILNEVGAGAINGLITGLIAMIIAVASGQSWIFGVIITVAMIFNLIVAGFFGAIIPLIMKKLGKDPATSATIFITTATDVLGFLAFLGLASLVLA